MHRMCSVPYPSAQQRLRLCSTAAARCTGSFVTFSVHSLATKLPVSYCSCVVPEQPKLSLAMAAVEKQLHNYTAVLEAPESPPDPQPVLQRVHSNFAISMQIRQSKLQVALNKRWAGKCPAPSHNVSQCLTMSRSISLSKCLALKIPRSHNALQCLTMPHNASQCLTMPHNTSQCLTMPRNALQCLTVPRRSL